MREGPLSPPPLGLTVDLNPVIHLAAHQNDVPVIRRILLHNTTEAAIEDIELKITSDLDLGIGFTSRITRLAPDERFELTPIDLQLPTDRLRSQTEHQRGHLTISATSGGVEATSRHPIELLAPTEWPGARALPELIAAFSMPNDPALAPVLKKAASLLGEATGDSAISGYMTHSRARVALMVQALYEAVQSFGVTFIATPASFEVVGQKVRSPGRLMGEGMGNCLDLTLLLTALMEQAGLNPIILVIEGHAFPGVWLNDFRLHEPTTDDPLVVKKRVELREALVFDSSAVAQGRSFEVAQRIAMESLSEPLTFRFAVDVAMARRHRIRPLSLVEGELVSTSAAREEEGTHGFMPAWGIEDLDRPESAPTRDGTASRLDRWKNKLLDLSLRNPLLNFRPTQVAVPLLAPALGALEDSLADEGRFEIHPRPSMMGPSDPRDVALHAARTGDDAYVALITEEQGSGRLRADLTVADLDKRLLELYRRSRTSFQESGAITLYLGVGFLRWFETPGSEQARLAPLILLPVELIRGQGREPYALKLADDESRVNVTLLKKLEVDFGLDTRGMDVPPADESGIDVPGIIERFRRLVLHQERWEILECCYLSELSFTKFLMWLDLEAKTEALLANPVVRHIFETKDAAFPLTSPLVEPDGLDERIGREPLTVVDADPTQLQAIFAAEDGNSFVLQGPPGTGKSQTITNMIAQLLARGKTVLFVSEKMAALSVVHERLERVGLGPFTLELHSHNASKRAVIDQVGQAFAVARDAKPPEGWGAHAEALATDREHLNAVAALLRAPSSFGVGLYQAISRLIRLRGASRLAVTPQRLDGLTAGQLAERVAAVSQVQRLAVEVEDQEDHPLRPLHAERWTPRWQREAVDALGGLAQAAAALGEAGGIAEKILHLSPGSLSRRRLQTLDALVDLVVGAPRVTEALVLAGDPEVHARKVVAWRSHTERHERLNAELAVTFQPQLLSEDLTALAARFQKWSGAFFILAFFMLFSARRRLKALTVSGEAPSNAQIIDDLERAGQINAEVAAVEGARADADALLGPLWRGMDTDWEAVDQALRFAAALRQGVMTQLPREAREEGRALRLAVVEERARFAPDGPDGAALLGYKDAHAAFDAAWASLADLLSLAWGDGEGIEVVGRRAKEAAAHGDELRRWVAYRSALSHAEAAGVAGLEEAILGGEIGPDQLSAAFERGLLETWIEGRFEEEPLLRAFRGEDHEKVITRFRDRDVRAAQLAQAEITARLAERMPDIAAPGHEMALLRRQLKLKKRHMPLRRLFAKIPTIIGRIKPCVLMSPLSVAQYLDPSLEGYDVVIFDEASQIPPWDAIGAIARGKQVVIVGDSRQLPPTSFFDRGTDDEPDDEDLEEMESILDEAVASGLPELRLLWHYRSRHESLITFSNHHYYENGLHTFPSANEAVAHLGVSLVHVKDGHYDRGSSATNRGEADALIEKLVELLERGDGRSVGVVTFSMRQQRLIEDLVDAKLQLRPELRAFFTEESREPVFIKNLENVQGDERDVMLFSICYGPDATGRVAMNFGPLNRKGGERRLNVAITRARQQLIVFSTLRAHDIDLSRSRAKGVAHLNSFLAYAEEGLPALIREVAPTGGEAESPFEAIVLSVLREAGYRVHPQVGCSGYRIDLGVIHPDAPGTYAIGVECDGATYHSSRSARERDRLRQSVLEGLGWRLHRVWSTDWWLDPKAESERLLTAVEAACTTSVKGMVGMSDAPSMERPRGDTAVGGGHAEQSARGLVVELIEKRGPVIPPEAEPYPSLPGTLLGTKDDFYDPSRQSDVAAFLHQVVERLGPLHRDHMGSVVIGAWDLKSQGRRIRELLDEARQSLPLARRPKERGDFIWPAGLDPERWRGIRVPSEAADTLRPAEHIPPEEIANVARWLARRALSIEREELAREAARILGFHRVARKVALAMDAGIALLLRHGDVTEQAGVIRWASA